METDDSTKMTECWKITGTEGDGSCPKLPLRGHCRNCSEYASAGRSLFDRAMPKDYQQQWTEIIAKEKEVEATELISVIVFRVRSEWLALRTRYFQEITDVRVVHSVPHRTNKIFRGLVNIGGELLLCASAAAILGVANEIQDHPAPYKFRRMLVIRKEGRRFAFEVDEVLGVHRVAPGLMQKVPATVSKSALALTKGIANIEDKKVGFLDEDAFMNCMSFDF